jgi:hypothetical protein
MSGDLAIRELCNLSVKPLMLGAVLTNTIQNISFTICFDSEFNIHQLPEFPGIYGVKGSGESIDSTPCTTITRVCNEYCQTRDMDADRVAVPFLFPRHNGCLGSCGCVSKNFTVY